MFHVLVAIAACLASSPALGADALYDDFTYPNTTFDRAKWWRGGLAGIDGTNAILNESDLTSSMMFSEGDFKFVIGGPSATTQGLLGLGDIDDGDPFLILSDSGSGWHFHVRNGSNIYTGPAIAPTLAKGDIVVFHWDSTGSSVSINGVVKDSQTTVHPPHMPLTMLEWNNTSTDGQIIMDSVSYSASTVSSPKSSATTIVASARTMVLSAKLVEDTFVDSSNPGTNLNGITHEVYIRNCRRHPDLTGAGKIVDSGQLGLVQFTLPQLPAGWNVASARLAGVVAQNHNLYGMPGWAPDRPIELEVLGLSANPDLTTVTYNAVHDATGHGVITDYTASGSVNFTFGSQAQSLEVLRFSTSTTPVGSVLQFPDQQGELRAFVRGKISQTEPRVITLAIGPGRTQAVSGMECDFKFYAKENTAGRAPMSLTLELVRCFAGFDLTETSHGDAETRRPMSTRSTFSDRPMTPVSPASWRPWRENVRGFRAKDAKGLSEAQTAPPCLRDFVRGKSRSNQPMESNRQQSARFLRTSPDATIGRDLQPSSRRCSHRRRSDTLPGGPAIARTVGPDAVPAFLTSISNPAAIPDALF